LAANLRDLWAKEAELEEAAAAREQREVADELIE